MGAERGSVKRQPGFFFGANCAVLVHLRGNTPMRQTFLVLCLCVYCCPRKHGQSPLFRLRRFRNTSRGIALSARPEPKFYGAGPTATTLELPSLSTQAVPRL